MTSENDWLVDLRRRFHRYPEPGWLEYHTTAMIVEQLRELQVDDIFIGTEAYPMDARLGVPAEGEHEQWLERARRAGMDPDLLEELRGGRTGVIAVARRGDGPVVGLRVDIDALSITESTTDTHEPAARGFRSENEGVMHACGHDAHASIGLGVLQTILESDFSGTLKLFFQPAEEGLRGGKALAQSPQLSDVDHLFAVHLGLGYSTGELVAGMEEMLASSKLRARFHGSAAHAGKNPEAGENAVQAMATAIQNLHAIPRHGDGASRVNVGVVEGGNALNIIPEDATIAIEVRGVTTEIAEYMVDRANRILDTAAKMHGCTVDTETIGEAPRVDSDRSLAAVVAEAAQALDSIDTVHEQAAFNASEDATHLMQAVNEQGGEAVYSVIGTDHPAGHHTPEFDVDERSIHIGVEMLSSAIERLDAE